MKAPTLDSPPGAAVPGPTPNGPALPQTVCLPTAASPEGLEEVARAYREYCARVGTEDPAALENWCSSLRDDDAGRAFREVQRSNPAAAARLADAAAEMPRGGQEWLGFQLLEELGRGAFGRVFLARQGDLANRLVALKVSADLIGETQTLALLQHTNIVPIYSAYRSGPLQALCMPYFGATTLADLVSDLGASPRLPSSGKALVDTLQQHRDSTRRGRGESPASPSQSAGPAGVRPGESPVPLAVRPQPHPEAVLERLGRLNYVEAVLWIGARLAEGLAHAHERGIVHRDLKPANVLLTDDGQPMLLDFNLSDNAHLRGAAAARLGGTLPYMAPEHLEAFRGGPPPAIDPRGDLYSLGVILFELLTGRHPYPPPQVPAGEFLERMLADRRTVPSLRRWNSRVSPAAESIVRRCLQPEAARRYQSAAQLIEDLERHRANLPLRHAPEPSVREWAAKWVRRHPRLAAAPLVTLAVAALVAVPAALYAGREERLHRTALETRKAFQSDRLAAERLLNRPVPGHDDLEAGARAARAALERYAVFAGPNWRDAPAVTRLPDGDRKLLGEEVGDLLLLLARALAVQADDERRHVQLSHGFLTLSHTLADDGREHGDDLVRTALKLNVRSEKENKGQPFSRAGWLQRADLAQRLGDREGEALARQKAAETPPRTARDHFLLAGELMARREYREALPHLRAATDLDPYLLWAWYNQGACHFEMQQDVEALQCYRAGLAFWPEAYELRLGRALVYQRQGRREQAVADFDEAVRLRADQPAIYVQRAELYLNMSRPADALRDLNLALKLDARSTRAWFLRAAVREKLGDQEGAGRDRAEGMRIEPADAEGWTARGRARADADPNAALADFDRALQLNPRFLPALQGKGHVLADVLKKNDEALVVLDQEVALYPDCVAARLGRGVLRARLGKCGDARDDARACLDVCDAPSTLYQAANIYSLTSARVEGDRSRALRLLTDALRGGFGLNMVDSDSDFEPIRNDPEFRKRVEAARTLRTSPAQPPG